MSTTYAPDGAAYAEAVEILLDLADRWPDESDGRAAAEVLLSCYNGYDFHLAPHAVRVFGGRRDRDAALTVIVQCAVFPKEPHQVVPEGERRFNTLWKAFEDELHVRRRYKSWYKSTPA